MHATDRVRRAVTVLLVAVFLLVAPQIAYAGFSTPKASGLAVGAASLVAPSSVQGSTSCSAFLFWERFDVSISSFTDPGPAGRAYTYTYVLSRNGNEVDRATGTAKRASLTTGTVGRGGSYTVSIESRLAGWEAPTFEVGSRCTEGNL